MKKRYWKVYFFRTDTVSVCRRIPLGNIIDISSPEIKQKLEEMFKSRVKTEVDRVRTYGYGHIKMIADTKGLVPLRTVIDWVNIYAPRAGNSKLAITQLQYASAWRGEQAFDELQAVFQNGEINHLK